MTDIRKIFEEKTETYYEGDFAKYSNGEYIDGFQQVSFMGFKMGYNAAAVDAELVRELVYALQSDSGALNAITKAKAWLDKHKEAI